MFIRPTFEWGDQLRVHRSDATIIRACLCLALLFGACGQDVLPSDRALTETGPATRTTPSTTGPPIVASPSRAAIGSDVGRVDLGEPVFSNPIVNDNPLFPRDAQTQVIQLGAEGPERLRFEVTQLPEINIIEWNGLQVETRVTQFVAYSDGRLLEVAVDFYAQADDGSVWYFGENVDNYENGVIADHEGTWLAGKDGPPGMIMPADPQVGDVYRPENIPGLVFEEVTVTNIDQSVAGPRGPVGGAVFVQERLMDGTVEDKIFAPGYGEFQAKVASLDELYDLALAVPMDAVTGAVPAELTMLSAGAVDAFGAVPSEDWAGASTTAETLTAAWERYRAGDVPKLLVEQMDVALEGLVSAIAAREPAATRQAAIAVDTASLDLQLPFRKTSEVDPSRLDVWSRQVLADVAADDAENVTGDAAVLETIRDRVAHALADPDRKRIDALLDDLRAAADDADVQAAGEVARTLRTTLAGL